MAIKKKLLTIALGTAGLSIIIIAIFLSFINYQTAKEDLLSDTQLISELIDENIRGALAFDDVKRTEEVLGTLRANPSIMQACLYNAAGILISKYESQDTATSDCPAPENYGITITGTQYILVGKRVEQNGVFLGSIYIKSNLKALFSYFRKQFLLSIAAIAVVFIAVSYPVAEWLQKSVSQPIYDLANATKQLSLPGQNVSLLPSKEDDEIRLIKYALTKIQPYLDEIAKNTVSKSMFHSVLSNKYLSFRYAQHYASVMNLSSKATKKFLEEEIYGHVPQDYMELLDINITISQDLKNNINELQELLELQTKILRQQKEFIDIADLVYEVYENIFADLKESTVLVLNRQNSPPLWPTYKEAVRKIIENVFSIFNSIENTVPPHIITVMTEESIIDSQRMVILTFHLDSNNKSASKELIIHGLPDAYSAMFKCKFFQNLIYPNEKNAVSFDIGQHSMIVTSLIPWNISSHY